MSRSRQVMAQASTSSSRSATRVEEIPRIRVSGTLRLRAENDSSVTINREEGPARRIRWSEDVIDNEGMGKKSSKVCCIFHKTRPVGESSSESESSSSDSDSSDSDNDRETGNGNNKQCQHHHHHDGDGSQASPERGRTSCCRSHDKRRTRRRKPSPNAYEKMPKYTKS